MNFSARQEALQLKGFTDVSSNSPKTELNRLAIDFQNCTLNQVFFGKVQGIRSLISYEGSNISELVSDYHEAVDDYLALCEADGTAPKIAYKGSLNLRFKNRDTHRRAAIHAITHEQNLNNSIEAAVEEKLAAIANEPPDWTRRFKHIGPANCTICTEINQENNLRIAKKSGLAYN